MNYFCSFWRPQTCSLFNTQTRCLQAAEGIPVATEEPVPEAHEMDWAYSKLGFYTIHNHKNGVEAAKNVFPCISCQESGIDHASRSPSKLLKLCGLRMIEHDWACPTKQEYQAPVVGVLSHWLTWTMVIMVKIETMRGQIWSSLRW